MVSRAWARATSAAMIWSKLLPWQSRLCTSLACCWSPTAQPRIQPAAQQVDLGAAVRLVGGDHGLHRRHEGMVDQLDGLRHVLHHVTVGRQVHPGLLGSALGRPFKGVARHELGHAQDQGSRSQNRAMRNQQCAGLGVWLNWPAHGSHERHQTPQAVGEAEALFMFKHEQRMLPRKVHVQLQLERPLSKRRP